jgi:hypothetical protein
MPQEMQFKIADTVLVGWISNVSIPALESLNPGSSDTDALNQSIGGHRIFRIAVTETRKGQPVSTQTVETYRCTGAYNTHIVFQTAHGGFRSCRFRVPAVGPNNSFKPKPLRGSA